MRIIGLTGGIASGKSTASRFFKEKGLPIIDADAIAHQLMAPGEVNYSKIMEEYGTEVLASDGTVDRKRLGSLVFSDVKALRRLEELTHPAIRERIGKEVSNYRQVPGNSCVLLDHPLLLEMGMERLVDEVWVVACTPEQQRKRLAERDGLSPQAIEERLASQMGTEEKMAKADRVIRNDGCLDMFLAQLEEVWKEKCPCSLESL